MNSILFVCMGNICRSPLAEGIARHRAAAAGISMRIDSAGTEDYHVGAPPDMRARTLARQRGTPIDDLRARQVRAADFLDFDLVLAADRRTLSILRELRPEQATAQLELLLAWCGIGPDSEVPDPYYGDVRDFESVYDLLDRAMPALLRRVTLG